MPNIGLAGTIVLMSLLFSATSASAALSSLDDWDRPEIARVLAQNPAAQCVNGYRVTHRVQGHGRSTQGVILKCRS